MRDAVKNGLSRKGQLLPQSNFGIFLLDQRDFELIISKLGIAIFMLQLEEGFLNHISRSIFLVISCDTF